MILNGLQSATTGAQLEAGMCMAVLLFVYAHMNRWLISSVQERGWSVSTGRCTSCMSMLHALLMCALRLHPPQPPPMSTPAQGCAHCCAGRACWAQGCACTQHPRFHAASASASVAAAAAAEQNARACECGWGDAGPDVVAHLPAAAAAAADDDDGDNSWP
eukprot:1162126-Pelagomonas_calceolata.AAC.5